MTLTVEAPPLASPTATLAGRLTEPVVSARTRALLARQDIAALVDQIGALTATQRAALEQACRANARGHSREQIRVCHRVSLADPDNFPDHAEVRAVVWQIAAAPRDGRYDAAVAASDMAFVLLSGPLLDPRERALFDGPWHAVLGAPPGRDENPRPVEPHPTTCASTGGNHG
jgi:hypothetical protein